ncbi:MAG: hypothetical protein GXO70_00605 [Acidobacteria bacterium]|nr:hypothetical protein [Acidobacteriota bacterium]
MKESNKIKPKRFILKAFLFFLTVANLSAFNRPTTPAFGSRSMTAISQTASIPKRPQQIYIGFHWQLTVIRVPTHHHHSAGGTASPITARRARPTPEATSWKPIPTPQAASPDTATETH